MKTIQVLILTIILSLINIVNSFAQEANTDPDLTGYHFENRKEEKVTNVGYEGKFVYLVLSTKNAIGESIMLEFDDGDGNYIYKRKYTISNSEIKFKIYNPNKKKYR